MSHHPVRMSSAMGKVEEWMGKIMVAAAVIGGVVVLITAFTTHVKPPW